MAGTDIQISGLAKVEMARRLFEEVQTRSGIRMSKVNQEAVELVVEFLPQKNLTFAILLNLQNRDELHLNVGKLWVSWFPLGNKEIDETFVATVIKIIEGTARVVEFYRGEQYLGGELQIQEGSEWKTVKRNYTAVFPYFWKPKKERVIRNAL